jgi:hypothetical protein
MFTPAVKTLAALVISLFTLVSAQMAPWDESQKMMDQMAAQIGVIQQGQQATMNDYINTNYSQIEASYQQCLQTSYSCGTFDDFAYYYAMSGGGQQMGSYMEMQGNLRESGQTALNGVYDAYGNFNDAIAADGVSRSNTATNVGETITNTGTYIDPYSGSSMTLPYTWQRETYNDYNGQTYYVDNSGQYYQVDPNNTSWMYPVNQAQ